VAVVADHAKLNKRAAFKICALAGIDTFISDRAVSKDLNKALLDAEVNVV